MKYLSSCLLFVCLSVQSNWLIVVSPSGEYLWLILCFVVSQFLFSNDTEDDWPSSRCQANAEQTCTEDPWMIHISLFDTLLYNIPFKYLYLGVVLGS